MTKQQVVKKMTGPLEGIRVLNMGTSIVGPWAATLLAHLGAEAIKIERPNGEFIRTLHPMQKGLSTCYTASNNHQLSAEFDIKKDDELKTVQGLAAQADVLIENLRPGVMDRIGLGFNQLSELNSGLVYASSSSWGDVGPMRDLAALDPHVQAFSGFGSLNGVAGGEPEMLRFVHMDPAGATVVASLALLGLIQRERFGHACHVKTSHFSMGITMQMNRAAESLLADQHVQLLGSATSASAPNQCFQMLDRQYIALTCETQAQWEGLCRAINRDDLPTDPRFISNLDRVANRDALSQILTDVIQQKPKRWWVVKLEKEHVPHGFSLDFEQIRNHQHIVENEFLTTIDAPHMGPILVADVPWQFSKTPARIRKRVSIPGEHTEQVIREGFGSPQRANELKELTSQAESPLAGLRVIDATQGYAGPFLGLLLAEAGAEVIKVEPKGGDWSKRLAPQTATGNSALYEAFNRNKTTLELDLDSKEGQQKLAELVDEAAVFLEDWGPGVAASRNLDYASLSKNNTGLVYTALTNFGEKGPMSHLPASELVIQAMTGYLRMLGSLDDAPVRVGADIVGTCTGSVALVGVLAALFHREKTGEGQRVATSLLGAMMSLKTNQWAAMSDPDEWLGDSYCTNETDTPHRGYQTKDRPVYMSPSPHLTEEDFLNMLDELGMKDEFLATPEFTKGWWFTFGMGYLARQAKPLWEKYTRQMSSKQILEIFARYDKVWAVEFADLGSLMVHPQVKAINLVNESDGQRYVRAPWRVPWQLPTVHPVRNFSREK